MRLGDLDALKKEVENLVVGGEKGLKDYYENGSKSDENAWIGGVYDAWELINNAPTVEPCYQTTSCLDCGNYDKENHNCPRYCEVIKEAINSRPQGEWKKIADVYCKCPFCSNVEVTFSNYCPECGARLEGGAE